MPRKMQLTFTSTIKNISLVSASQKQNPMVGASNVLSLFLLIYGLFHFLLIIEHKKISFWFFDRECRMYIIPRKLAFLLHHSLKTMLIINVCFNFNFKVYSWNRFNSNLIRQKLIDSDLTNTISMKKKIFFNNK